MVTLQDLKDWKEAYTLAANGSDRGYSWEIRRLAKEATHLGLPGLLDMVALCKLAEVALVLERETKKLCDDEGAE